MKSWLFIQTLAQQQAPYTGLRQQKLLGRQTKDSQRTDWLNTRGLALRGLFPHMVILHSNKHGGGWCPLYLGMDRVSCRAGQSEGRAGLRLFRAVDRNIRIKPWNGTRGGNTGLGLIWMLYFRPWNGELGDWNAILAVLAAHDWGRWGGPPNTGLPLGTAGPFHFAKVQTSRAACWLR
jgi:hypothetical protein